MQAAQQQDVMDVDDDTSHITAVLDKRGLRGWASPIHPWKAEELCTLSTLRDLVTFNPSPRVGVAVELFVVSLQGSLPRSSQNVILQEVGTILQEVCVDVKNRAVPAKSQLQLRFMPHSTSRWMIAYTEHQVHLRRALDAHVIPDLASIVAVYGALGYDHRRLGVWHHLDRLVAHACAEQGFPSRSEKAEELYVPLCDHIDDEDRAGVTLDFQCDNQGNPMFELLDHNKEVLYRHSNHAPTVQAWAASDAAFKKLHGCARGPLLTPEACLALLVAGRQVRFLWGWRGYGYKPTANEVKNYGALIKIQLLQ